MIGPTTREQPGFVVELEKFSGPLDLLLHLIREDEVDITDLPVAKIADQFLSVINELELIGDRKSTRLNSSHSLTSRMPSSA